ncbi:SRV2 [Sanghuangporus vaninii]
MSQGGLHSLATIIKRLEAATSRLEDLAVAQASGTAPKFAEGSVDKGAPDASGAAAPPPPPPPPPLPAAMTEIPRSVEAFDGNIINGRLKAFVELTKSFASPLVIEQVGYVENVFKGLRALLLTVGSCTKPDSKTFATLQEPIAKEVTAVMQVPEKNRKERVWYNHLMVIAEGIPSVGWVGVEPKPGPHVAQMKEAAEFYGNKVIKEFKEKEPKHVEWVRAWISLLEEQRKYVMEFHTTGLAWNPKGVPVNQFSASSGSAGAPPPPPPPPPAVSAPSPSSSGSGLNAVFADLNRGTDVTKGLRKVDKSEMTHKNPELRASSAVPATPGAAHKKPIKPTKPAALAGKKPGKFVLEGTKWIIENQENESGLVVENTEISHVVHLFGCKNTTVQIKGKVNAVNMINCNKTSLLVDSVVSSISITKSPSFAIQITGAAPTIQLDSTDSGQIYLSKTSLDVEITTAKCSAINVSLPVEGEEDGVFVERAMPEMMRTTIQDGKLVTTIVEHAG